jgi:hypothetical protein
MTAFVVWLFSAQALARLFGTPKRSTVRRGGQRKYLHINPAFRCACALERLGAARRAECVSGGRRCVLPVLLGALSRCPLWVRRPLHGMCRLHTFVFSFVRSARFVGDPYEHVPRRDARSSLDIRSPVRSFRLTPRPAVSGRLFCSIFFPPSFLRKPPLFLAIISSALLMFSLYFDVCPFVLPYRRIGGASRSTFKHH